MQYVNLKLPVYADANFRITVEEFMAEHSVDLRR